MNRANNLARQRTAVDIVNALILLIKLEGTRFNHYKQKAWERDEILTCRGQDLMEEAFRGVNLMEYRISMNKCDSFHRITVSRMTSTNEYTVIIPVEETMGRDLELAHVESQRQTESRAGTWLLLQCPPRSKA